MKTSPARLVKGFALIAAIFVFCSCSKPKDLRYGIVHGVSVKSFSFTGVDVEAMIPVENPNSYTINVQEADLDILSDDKVIAHVKQSAPVALAAKSKGDYKVTAFITLVNKGEIASVMRLINGNGNLNLDGTAKIKSFVFSKTVKVHQNNIQEYLKPLIGQMKLF